MPDKRKFLNTPDAARYISRHRSTLDKWRAENLVLPYYRDRLKVWYAVDDLDAPEAFFGKSSPDSLVGSEDVCNPWCGFVGP